MSGPTGLIFAMRSRYKTQGGTEALFDEAESKFSGNAANANIPGSAWNFNKFACTKQPCCT